MASPLDDCRRLPGCPRVTWFKTIQQDLQIKEHLPERSDQYGSEPTTLVIGVVTALSAQMGYIVPLISMMQLRK